MAQPHALPDCAAHSPKRRCLSGDCFPPCWGCSANLASPISPTSFINPTSLTSPHQPHQPHQPHLSPTSLTSLTSLARQDEAELPWVLWPGSLLTPLLLDITPTA